MIAIRELIERLQLLENISKQLDISFNADRNYVVLASKVCVFLYYDANDIQSISDDFIKMYSKIFVITNDEKIDVKNVNSIKKITIEAISSWLEKTKDKEKIFKVVNNDYDYIFKALLKQEVNINEEKNNLVCSNKKSIINSSDLYFDSTYKKFNKQIYYSEKDNSYVLLICSKPYFKKKFHNYWYSIHQYQIKLLKNKNSFILFSFKDTDDLIKIPFSYLNERFEKLGKTTTSKETYYHIYIDKYPEKGYLLRIPNVGREELNHFLIQNKKVNDKEPKYVQINGLQKRTVLNLSDRSKEVNVSKRHK